MLTIIWVRSYYGVDSIQYCWTPRRNPEQLKGIACGWYQGHLGFSYFSEPQAWENYLATRIKPLPVPSEGFHLRSFRVGRPMTWHDLWFDVRHYYRIIPANADGTIAMSPGGTAVTNAARQLPQNEYNIGIPLWLPIVLIAAFPASQLLNLSSRRRRLRVAAGQCVSCGYDLRATPQRCPECGAVPQPMAKRTAWVQRIQQFVRRSSTLRAVAIPAIFILTLVSSMMICEFISQTVIHRRWKFMETWTPDNRIIAYIALCALAILCSSLIALLLFDRLRVTAGPRPLKPRTPA